MPIRPRLHSKNECGRCKPSPICHSPSAAKLGQFRRALPTPERKYRKGRKEQEPYKLKSNSVVRCIGGSTKFLVPGSSLSPLPSPSLPIHSPRSSSFFTSLIDVFGPLGLQRSVYYVVYVQFLGLFPGPMSIFCLESSRFPVRRTHALAVHFAIKRKDFIRKEGTRTRIRPRFLSRRPWKEEGA